MGDCVQPTLTLSVSSPSHVCMSSNTINRRGQLLPTREMLGELQRLDGKIGSNETYTDRLSKHFSFLESKIDAMKQVRIFRNHCQFIG